MTPSVDPGATTVSVGTVHVDCSADVEDIMDADVTDAFTVEVLR